MLAGRLDAQVAVPADGEIGDELALVELPGDGFETDVLVDADEERLRRRRELLDLPEFLHAAVVRPDDAGGAVGAGCSRFVDGGRRRGLRLRGLRVRLRLRLRAPAAVNHPDVPKADVRFGVVVLKPDEPA